MRSLPGISLFDSPLNLGKNAGSCLSFRHMLHSPQFLPHFSQSCAGFPTSYTPTFALLYWTHTLHGMASSSDPAPSSGSAPGGDNSLHGIIASYLKKKGYQRSLESFASDTGTSVDKIAVQMDLMSDSTVLQMIMNYNSTEKFPGSFEQSFHALSVWVEKCLDQCKVREARKVDFFGRQYLRTVSAPQYDATA